jgi:hypothetical protein
LETQQIFPLQNLTLRTLEFTLRRHNIQIFSRRALNLPPQSHMFLAGKPVQQHTVILGSEQRLVIHLTMNIDQTHAKNTCSQSASGENAS